MTEELDTYMAIKYGTSMIELSLQYLNFYLEREKLNDDEIEIIKNFINNNKNLFEFNGNLYRWIYK